MRRALSLVLCLAVVGLAACGGGDDDSSGPLDAGLAYLPADTPFALSIDTDLEGDQVKALDSLLGKFPFGDRTIEELIAQEVAGADSDVDFEEDVKPVLGNPAVVGATDVTSFLAEDNDESFVAALQAADQDALDNLIEKSGAKENGETAGATRYEDQGSVFAVDGDVVVLANSEAALDRALERADGDDRLTQERFEGAFEQSPDAALAGVYANLEALIRSSPGGRTAAEQVEWVGALRTLGLTAEARDDGVTVDFMARTDPEGLTEDDLPMAAGDASPPVLVRDGEIGFGLRGLAQVIRFAETAGQAIDPSGFGDYEQAKQTLDSRLGVSIDDDLIAQLEGDLAASVTLAGEFGARAELEDPAAFRRTLARVAPVLSAPAAGEGLYRLPDADGAVAVFGVVDDVFVVASDEQRAREIAREDPEDVNDASGALVMRSDAEALVNAVIQQIGPALGLGGVESFGARLFTGPLEDLTGSMSAETDGLRGRLQLAVE